MRARAKHQTGISFSVELRNTQPFVVDSAPEFGGQNLGASPKEVLLGALCSCTGMDSVALFHKKDVKFTTFEVEARAVPRENHPKVFQQVEVTYVLQADQGQEEIIKECIHRSMHRYSPIAYLLTLASPVIYNIKLNETEIVSKEQAFKEV